MLNAIAPDIDIAHGLHAKITNRTAVIGVVGIGYVGLPLAVEKTKVGFSVIGFDRSAARVEQAGRGDSYIGDVSQEELGKAVSDGLLTCTTDFAKLRECDVIVICVPTPLTKNKQPDLSYVQNVAGLVAGTLRPGQLISLESTTYPGTTEEVLLPAFTATGLEVGRDFFLAFSPERVDPGNKRYTTKNINKVVGGVTPACLSAASFFYRQTILNVLEVSSPRVAEMTKVFENTFRAVNIALVNELAQLCDPMDINIWEVVEAANSKPFGIMRFNPGPGVGGHCIPLDPYYLSWKAKEYDFNVRFIELAGEINARMPHYVRARTSRALNEVGKALRGANILALGVAYKRDIDDWRESPATQVISLLEQRGAHVSYHDPHVPFYINEAGERRESVEPDAQRAAAADCVLILTDHTEIPYADIVKHARLIVDTRNALSHITEGREKIVLL